MGIDINKDYCISARKRIRQIQPRLFEERATYNVESNNEAIDS